MARMPSSMVKAFTEGSMQRTGRPKPCATTMTSVSGRS